MLFWYTMNSVDEIDNCKYFFEKGYVVDVSNNFIFV